MPASFRVALACRLSHARSLPVSLSRARSLALALSLPQTLSLALALALAVTPPDLLSGWDPPARLLPLMITPRAGQTYREAVHFQTHIAMALSMGLGFRV